MDKRQFLITTMNQGTYVRLDWLISLLAITKPKEDAEPYPGRVIYGPNQISYLNDEGQAIPISDAKIGEPLFHLGDKIKLTPKDCSLVDEEIETDIGLYITNMVLIHWVFGGRIRYINTEFNISKHVDAVMLKDFRTDVPAAERDPKAFYVEDRLRFSKALDFYTGLSQVTIITCSRKSMSAPDGLEEFKAEQRKKYAGQLGDPAVIAQMDKELIEFDANWRKGDKGNQFLMDKKSVNVTRKKKYLQIGGQSTQGGKTRLMSNSLYDGWRKDQFVDLCNAMRMGQYSRGAETVLGGVEVKWLVRASYALKVTIDDCGSQVGLLEDITEESAKHLPGRYVIQGGKPLYIEKDADVSAYLGKRLMLRSPGYCKAGDTNYCKICVGKDIADIPGAISGSVVNLGSRFLNLFLGKFHSVALTTEELTMEDYNM